MRQRIASGAFVPRALCGVLALASVGCGAEFDPPSELVSLRVLGVQKSAPYAQPGDEVTLSLLWHDGEPRAEDEPPREIQRVWSPLCVNPPGDLYYACFPQLLEAYENGDLGGAGDRFTVTLPEDIVSGRGGPFEPGQPRYGIGIVFFAVCAGTLTPAEVDPDEPGFPLQCVDEDGTPLGSNDFVAGYTSIYSFPDASNQNPIVTGFRVAGESFEADCIGDACVDAPEVDVNCEDPEEDGRCIDACEDDGDDSCPSIKVQPLVDPESAELDEVTSESFGETIQEQMWINYYVDRGGINDVRLLNDATKGWNESYRAELRAPKAPGLLRVWSVVHDNRGGSNWARMTLRVRD